jgi:predicted nucleotidyltransferase
MHNKNLSVLIPKTRLAVLSACLLQPEKWWYLSDLAKFLKVTPSTLQRELVSLTKIELLKTKKDGNRVYYKANKDWPGMQDLQSLIIKNDGIIEIINGVLKKFSGSIDISFIYGSYARAEEVSTSDIDLMIIGNIKLSELATYLRKAEKTIGREINPTIYSLDEIQKKVDNKDAFIKTVFKDKKIFLKGTEIELKAFSN